MELDVYLIDGTRIQGERSAEATDASAMLVDGAVIYGKPEHPDPVEQVWIPKTSVLFVVTKP